MAVVERWPLVEIGLLLITERRDLIQSFKVHFVVTAFDCKDENSFGFSLFVDVRFKLCSVLLIWIKHPLLFRNTVEPPLTATNGHFSAMAIFSWRTVHTFTLVSTCLLWPLSSVPKVAVVEVQLYLETILSCWKVMTVLAVLFFFYYQKLSNLSERKRKEKKGKQNKAPKQVSYVIKRFI